MKPVSAWVDRYKSSAGTAQQAYVSGVQNSQKSWQSASIAAIPAMVQGFTQAANDGRIQQGFNRVSDSAFKSAVQAKQQNYGTGITLGADKYAAAAAKLGPAIAQGVASLGPRGPVGSPQNYARANALGQYLHGLRGQLGA